jgi:hypothetical protein
VDTEMIQVHERDLLKVRLIGYASATAVVIVGCAGLAGWVFNVAALRTIVPGMASMKENAAIALVLTGISMLLLNREPPLVEVEKFKPPVVFRESCYQTIITA